MKNRILVVATAALLSTGGMASADHHAAGATNQAGVITISCFRGPWEEVIWDRPEPVFVDSLVAYGYSFPEAHAIAERVCRDAAGVDRPDVSTEVLLGILRASPPR